jgi:predicted  nucleic acid-binding Zn-ribbon protein
MERIEEIEKRLSKVEAKLWNGISEWIASTTLKLSVLTEDDTQISSEVDEIRKRVEVLEVSSGALSARQSVVMIVIVAIITAAINLLFKR